MFDQFDAVAEQPSLSERFDIYRATSDGTDLFIKVASEETSEWSRNCIRKEYEILDQLDIECISPPEAEFYTKYDQNTEAVGMSWIEFTDAAFDRLDNERYQTQLLDDFTAFLTELHSHQRPDISIYWPHDDEIRNRLTAEVAFNPGAYTGYFSLLEQAQNEIFNRLPTVEKTLIHGDLFYPNIGFSNKGRLKTVFDWEQAAWFDPMYDVAFIEAAVLDCLYGGAVVETSHEDIRRQFRNLLNLSDDEIERLLLYKLWPYYVNLAAADLRENGESPWYFSFENKKTALMGLEDMFDATTIELEALGILT